MTFQGWLRAQSGYSQLAKGSPPRLPYNSISISLPKQSSLFIITYTEVEDTCKLTNVIWALERAIIQPESPDLQKAAQGSHCSSLGTTVRPADGRMLDGCVIHRYRCRLPSHVGLNTPDAPTHSPSIPSTPSPGSKAAHYEVPTHATYSSRRFSTCCSVRAPSHAWPQVGRLSGLHLIGIRTGEQCRSEHRQSPVERSRCCSEGRDVDCTGRGA